MAGGSWGKRRGRRAQTEGRVRGDDARECQSHELACSRSVSPRKCRVRCDVSGCTHRTGQPSAASVAISSPTRRSTSWVRQTARNNRHGASIASGAGGRDLGGRSLRDGMTISIWCSSRTLGSHVEGIGVVDRVRIVMATAFLGPRGTFSEEAALLRADTDRTRCLLFISRARLRGRDRASG